MSESEALARLQRVFDAVFVDPPLVHARLTAKEVPEWDSVKHIELLMAIEKEFGLNFSVGEMMEVQQIAGLVAVLVSRAAP